MRILIACAPYKECLDAASVADAIEIGITQIMPDAYIHKLPLCDGGTGIVERFIEAKGGQKVPCNVHDPLMNEIASYFGILDDGTAIVESARAAGLALVPAKMRNPLVTSTYGVGDLIKEALKHNCKKIIIGCGDSATNDGGVGMAQSLGVRFFDSDGREVSQGGKELLKITRIDTTQKQKIPPTTEVVVACNITSILSGEDGTTRRYAKQKGATPEIIEYLDKCIANYADVLSRFLGWDLRFMPGTGAAGGLGAGLLAFAGANLRYSMDLVCELLDVKRFLQESDLVITGEGMADATSATGKAPCAIGLLAKKYNLPTISIVGSIGDDADIVSFHGLDLVESSLKHPLSMQEALNPESTKTRITDATIRIMRFFKREIAGVEGRHGHAA